jgi:glyoxylase-like metal-dependent hydrolase (beta-lactamase superfamily II)
MLLLSTTHWHPDHSGGNKVGGRMFASHPQFIILPRTSYADIGRIFLKFNKSCQAAHFKGAAEIYGGIEVTPTNNPNRAELMALTKTVKDGDVIDLGENISIK